MPPKRKRATTAKDAADTPAKIAAPKLKENSKRKRAPKPDVESSSNSDSGVETPKKKVKSTSVEEKAPPKAVVTVTKNKTTTSYDGIDLSCTRKNKLGKLPNFKISNWNVDGIRAWIKKGGLEYFQFEKPDILCLQETKCALDKLPVEVKEVDGYKVFWNISDKDAYAGVGLYSKIDPISVKYGLDNKELDTEGRMITAEFEDFYVISVYVPNAGRKLVTLPKRLEWNDVFREYVAELNKKKPVIVCGDMNVAHLEIDLSNPKTNRRNAGFTQEERDGMTEFLSDGYIDTFRQFYPDKTGVYTFWTYMFNCRAKNVGWRLDYFLVSEKLMDSVCDSLIRNEIYGSDHCPITLFLNV